MPVWEVGDTFNEFFEKRLFLLTDKRTNVEKYIRNTFDLGCAHVKVKDKGYLYKHALHILPAGLTAHFMQIGSTLYLSEWFIEPAAEYQQAVAGATS